MITSRRVFLGLKKILNFAEKNLGKWLGGFWQLLGDFFGCFRDMRLFKILERFLEVV